jgi:non-ribosomal peptide synthetase component F
MIQESVSISPGDALLQDAPVLLHQFFEDAVRRWPGRTAVEVPPGHGRPQRRSVTYAELGRQADSVAHALRRFLGREGIVAILLPRDTERLYSSQLGVLQAGGAYASIDPIFPDGRMREILEDAAAVALLTDAAGAARARAMDYRGSILLVEELGELPAAAVAQSAPIPGPGNLAYVIYTSGSTGRPKGVMIEHRSIVNLVASDLEEFRLTPEARVAQSSSSVYDSSVEEIWLALAAGATLVVLDEEAARLGPDLAEWLRRERITVLCPTPTMLRAMGCGDPDGELPELAVVYVGGEALPQDLSDRWSKGRRLTNDYGPTECAVSAMRADMRPGEPVSIGRPITGFQAWVLDDARQIH